jgi:hypothetical protein
VRLKEKEEYSGGEDAGERGSSPTVREGSAWRKINSDVPSPLVDGPLRLTPDLLAESRNPPFTRAVAS